MRTVVIAAVLVGVCAIALRDAVAIEEKSGVSIWSIRDAGITNNLNSVIYCPLGFMAAGSKGVIPISSDGTNWLVQNVGATNELNGLAFANGLYVAVGSHGALFTSEDGLTWSNQFKAPLPPNDLYSVCYGGGQFLAVGQNSTILTSPDGTNWSRQLTGSNTNLVSVCYGNGCYISTGMSFEIVVLRSTNGSNWVPANPSILLLRSMVFAEGHFTGVGGNSPAAPGGYIATSVDGITWTTRNSGFYDNFGGVAYGNGCFVAVDSTAGGFSQPAAARNMSSEDSVHWTSRPDPATNALQSVAYGNGSFVAVGKRGTIMQSGPIFRMQGASEIGSDGYALTISGETGRVFQVQAEADVTASNWVDIAIITNVAGTTEFLDSGAAGAPRRFYRALTQ